MDLSLLLAIALIIAIIFWLNRRQSRQRPTSPRSQTRTASSQSVRGNTQRQLLRLVGGNQSVAERLVEQVKLNNPSQNEQWCWEKAIYDIQRDRHSS